METKKITKLIKVASCAILCSVAPLSNQVQAETAADWMSGEFGIGWRFNPPNRSSINNWDVQTLVDQVKSVPRVKYVIMNLSDAASGDTFIAPHSVISQITPSATPDNDRDLFMEQAQAFKAEGIKVIAYIACQGPAMLKHGAAGTHDRVSVNGVWESQGMENWAEFVQNKYGDTTETTYKKAFARVIFTEFAQRYGTLIDGWWLDNGDEFYDARLLHKIAKANNPDVAVFSGDEDYKDFVSGHPLSLNGNNPTLPNDPANKTYLLDPIEESIDGYIREGDNEALGHMFMPLHDKWNSGPVVWTKDEGVEWMTSCMQAGGAWTWNIDVNDSASTLDLEGIALIKEVVAEIPDFNNYNLVQIRKRNAMDYCLNFGGADPYNGQNVKLWSYTPDHDAMTWEEIDLGNGFFHYRKKGTNFSLDGGNGGANQQNVYIWKTDVNNFNQQWKKIDKGNGYIQLRKRGINYAVNGGSGGANMQNVSLWRSQTESQNLQWKIEYR